MRSSRRSKLEVLVEAYRVDGQDSYGGPSMAPLGSFMALVSLASTGYSASEAIDPTSPLGASKEGSARIFSRSLPAGLKAGDVLRFEAISDEDFQIKAIDPRGKLPGGYSYRVEALS